MMSDSPPPTAKPIYSDDDLVYVDPDTKSVVGKVEFGKNDNPKSKMYQPAAQPEKKEKDGKPERRSFFRKVYPFGTYRSMKRIYKVEGKIKDPEPNKTLEEVLPKALNEAFWTWGEKKAVLPADEAPKA
jgi:hypothetical protein